MRSSIKSLAVALVCLSMVASCASVNLSEFKSSTLDSKMADQKLPQYILNNQKPKVAVLPPSDATQFNNSRINLSETCQENVTQLLAQTGALDVVERSQLKKFMEEMKFQAGINNEIDADKFAQIAKGVDFVLVGSISTAGLGARFIEASTWQDKNGKTYYNPPTCSEQANVMINYRLILFPSGRVEKAFQMEGQKSSLPRNVRSSYECQPSNPQLLQEAIYRAVDNAKESILEAFPSYGYVYKTMTNKSNPKSRVAYITLGTKDGVQAGNKLEIFDFLEEMDPVKGIPIHSNRTIAECKVIENDLQADKCICVVSEDNADSVYVNQAVKTKVSTSFLRGFQKAYRQVF